MHTPIMPEAVGERADQAQVLGEETIIIVDGVKPVCRSQSGSVRFYYSPTIHQSG